MKAARFAIDTRAVCVWSHDPLARNMEFLGRTDPTYLEFIAKSHADHMDSELKQAAALGLRLSYSHALEALFAFLCASIQAPECVFGWLAEYHNAELRSLVRKISNGERIYSKLTADSVTWHAVSEAILQPLVLDDLQKTVRIREGFGKAWHRLAGEFLDHGNRTEYNSIKHGFRASPGGVHLSIGPETTPGIPCPPEKMKSIGGSEFGSSFFILEPIHDTRNNFKPRRMTHNWSPSNLANALMLVSSSLKNIVSRLRIYCGEAAEQVQFYWPPDPDTFALPWKDNTGVFEVSLDMDVRSGDSKPLSDRDILKVYASVIG